MHPTIKSYMSAIQHFVILQGQDDPFQGDPFPLLQYAQWSESLPPSPKATTSANRASNTMEPLDITKARLYHAVGHMLHGLLLALCELGSLS